MEIKSKARGKIQIPTGCKATIENNQILIEEEQKQEEFKDGDILISKYTNSVAIFENYIREDRLKFYPIIIVMKILIAQGWLPIVFVTLRRKKNSISLMS